ncbi:putative formin-like protein 6 isoform X2 [Iris pallida]|uniref:Formin-like protein 6 isoform X2 n=1 Tax=Iris pallida TaxID=29817 RepID=A0AAX6FWN5_IRIPA|nr:putative formin-like protein 6 isoform X2 [Iris pallida]
MVGGGARRRLRSSQGQPPWEIRADPATRDEGYNGPGVRHGGGWVRGELIVRSPEMAQGYGSGVKDRSALDLGRAEALDDRAFLKPVCRRRRWIW